jgi:hypothetical protein
MPRPRAIPAPAGTPDPGELAARFFRGLYQAWDLHSVEGVHVAVPKGTAFLAARSLAEIARQIGEHPTPPPVPGRGDLTAAGPAGRTR